LLSLDHLVGECEQLTVIVGVGINPSGKLEAWIARLPLGPPPPTSIVAAAPNVRATTLGTAVTGFATIVNALKRKHPRSFSATC
jgi:hypothetical protein